jgi:hypothetical protein
VSTLAPSGRQPVSSAPFQGTLSARSGLRPPLSASQLSTVRLMPCQRLARRFAGRNSVKHRLESAHYSALEAAAVEARRRVRLNEGR